MDVREKVKLYIERQGLVKKGDRILLGLSGGADSVCLFYLLLELRKELGFALRAVHVNHGIRQEAEEDATCVKELCRRENVYCYLFCEDVPSCAKEQGLSEEEAGRVVRYRDFEESLRRWQREEAEALSQREGGCRLTDAGQEKSEGVEALSQQEGCCGQKEAGRTGLETEGVPLFKIATAHHENDQAETVLFQLFRGCGLAGLRGILPKRGNIIRPLLCLSREEIERFLKEKGISWCEDQTNRLEDYSRNKIRRRILPCAEAEICHGAAEHIAKTADIVREAEEYIRRQVREVYQKTAAQQEGAVVFDIVSLGKEDIFLQKQLVLYGLERILAARKDIGAVHVEDILKLIGKQGNGELFLPDGVRVCKVYRKLLLFRQGTEQAKTALPGFLTEKKGFLCGEKMPDIKTERIDLLDKGAVKKRFGIQNIPEIMACIPQKEYTKWFDYDKIRMPFSVRHRESGDYLTIDREMNRKSLRRYMIENKIPASRRDRIWFLADGSHVIWVPGGRISTYYKVTDQTKTILQIEICREE